MRETTHPKRSPRHGSGALRPIVLLVLSAGACACVAPAGGTASSDEVDFCEDGKCDGWLADEAGPISLDYDELVELSELDGVWEGGRYRIPDAPALGWRVDQLLTTPFVSNEAFRAGVRPHRPLDRELGPLLRALQWNVERGQELDAILEAFEGADALTRPTFFLRMRRDVFDDDDALWEVNEQLEALADLDVLVLNEVDVGMARSGYRHVAQELAEALEMNWAFATEFVEVDPTALGTETIEREDLLPEDAVTGEVVEGTIDEETLQRRLAETRAGLEVEPDRVRNLHGNAILSRYPIVFARSIPLETQCWDWNDDERGGRWNGIPGMRQIIERVFLEKMHRQLRHGARHALIVDLLVPGVTADGTTFESVPGTRPNVVTVVNVHLEARSTPQCRRRQMREVLSHLEDVGNPVILAGDLNTVGGDGRPMTLERLLLSRFRDPQWVARQLIRRFVPYAGWTFTTLDAVNWLRLKDDPTGRHIPLLLPNRERGLFDAIEDHVFLDRGRFDFRGDSSRTVNGTGRTLANSNQRDRKGFKTTFAFARPIEIGDFTIIGRFKLDWMFVRGYSRTARDRRAAYRFAPHRPRTLEELRDSTSPRLSDHAPITVDIPLRDPCPEGECEWSDDDLVDPEMDHGSPSWEELYIDR